CHAAIVSRELGIPCIVGTGRATEVIKNHQSITVSCAEGEQGNVYQGLLKYQVKKINLQSIGKTKTKIMMNVGEPRAAFLDSMIPNDGVGLAREEFIINNFIKIHPLALLNHRKLKDQKAKREIARLTANYQNKSQFFVDKLAEGVGRIAAAFYPKDVIVRLSDFKSNEYANLIGGREFEPQEGNPMIGWRGASRYYDHKYLPAFKLECAALKKVREVMGLRNVKIMIPFCRTIAEGKKVQVVMAEHGLKRGVDGLQVYVMCEIPANVILAKEFCQIFDGFSIGSNDLTQLALGVDRDSALVSHVYNERNEAVTKLIEQIIKVAHQYKRKVGICGQAPSDFPEFAQMLVKLGIDSISLIPDTVIKTTLKVLETEKR
ncbi:MAG: phosphoenolpyruvate synthase, partial [Candidatus Komeilibacteria bacterium CG_4_9_14_3_um_filter_37_5]